MAKTLERKKINFMLDKQIIGRMEELIPAGKRSDFVNQTLEEALTSYGRRKAAEEMDKLAKTTKMRMSTEEFVKLKNYGRP